MKERCNGSIGEMVKQITEKTLHLNRLITFKLMTI
jgi:hypothetical protein